MEELGLEHEESDDFKAGEREHDLLEGDEKPDDDVVYQIKDAEYDIDYYYRELPPTPYPMCEIPGITQSMCIPKEDLKEQTPFCFDDNYEFVCVPIEHFLWPLWTIEQKDYEIQEKISL